MPNSQKLTKFKTPYASVEEVNGMGLLYSIAGDYSVIIRILNPVIQDSGNDSRLISAQQTYTAIAGLIDENCILQKQDIFAKSVLQKDCDDSDWLKQSYFGHFNGNEYVDCQSYLIVTHQVNKGFFTFDSKQFYKFLDTVESMIRYLASAGMKPQVLDHRMIKNYLMRSLAVNFSQPAFSLDSIQVDRSTIQIGERNVRQISLVDLDEINFPLSISSYRSSSRYEDLDFPEDNMTFLLKVPNVDTVIYSQALFMPNQMSELKRLRKKRNYHISALGENNATSAEDITKALEEIAKTNKKLVYANYCITLAGKSELSESVNYIEQQLYPLGITPSKRCVNQFELFRGTALPANAVELKKYDKFLLPLDAALCLFYKESPQVDERTQFPIYFCTREGVPVAIDMFDAAVRNERIPSPHMMVIGPSGSGKSFFMNFYIRQNLQLKSHIVLIDIGNSYRGLCEYYGGKYVTYTPEKPITMNPFRIESWDALTSDKYNFFLSLITVIWKGSEKSLSKSEETVIQNALTAYYKDYFQQERQSQYLCFNTFYDFAKEYVTKEIEINKINFDLMDFLYVLRKFTQGGIYEYTLNEEIDKSLLEQQFVIFEIDSIKGDGVLYPIVTLVIMDLFTEKIMNLPKEIGKIFIIEEAWKSITSPVMQPYIIWLWKTIRKHRGQAVVVTQEIQDLLDNPVIKDVIVNNSPIKCLLKQEAQTFKKLVEYLALSDAEANIVASLGLMPDNIGSKEVYIKRGNYGEAYKVLASPQEYWVYTTRNEEKALVEKYKVAFGKAFAAQCEKWINTILATTTKYTVEQLKSIYDNDHSVIKFAIEQLIADQKIFLESKKGLKDDFLVQTLNPEHKLTLNIPLYEKELR